LAELCLEQGHEVAVCGGWNPLPQQLEKIKSHSSASFIEKKIIPGRWNNVVPGRFKLFTESYWKEIIAWKADLAIVSQGNNMDGLVWMEFLKNNSIRFVSISQAVYEGIWPRSEKAERVAGVFMASEMNYFVSTANQRMTELMLATRISKSKLIYNPFNVPYYNDLSFPSVETGYKLACVARYEFYAKGQDVLLEVLSDKLWKEREINVNFYGKGQNEEGLKKLINYFGIKNCTVNSYTPTINIWEENHALVLPSRFEGLPLALVEAMLCARFGIVTDISGNCEVLEDNISGFVAAAPKARYLHEAMERAWQQKDYWETIGLRAQEKIQSVVPDDPVRFFYDDLRQFFVKKTSPLV
jgi:glycosyltransferase involved in cell wall biosynthesis